MSAVSQPPSPPFQAASAPQTGGSESEVTALKKIGWFAILQLVGVVVGWIFAYETFSNFPPLYAGETYGSTAFMTFFTNMFTALMFITPITLAVQLVGLYLLRSGFKELSKLDPDAFSTPALLIISSMVGVILAEVGLVPFIYYLRTIFSRVAANVPEHVSPIDPSAFPVFVLFIGLLAAGGVLALVGLIGGQMLGLWQVGSRYDSTPIKLGSIFLIIPLLNWVAPVLVLVGALDARHRIPVT